MPGTMVDIPPQLQDRYRLDAQGVHGVDLTVLQDSSTSPNPSEEPLSSIQKLRARPDLHPGPYIGSTAKRTSQGSKDESQTNLIIPPRIVSGGKLASTGKWAGIRGLRACPHWASGRTACLFCVSGRLNMKPPR